jgi:hypothetical protein
MQVASLRPIPAGVVGSPPAPQPQIIMPDYGTMNRDLRRQQARLMKGKTYEDLSTVCITPLPAEVHQDGQVIRLTGLPVRVVSALRGLIIPMNQKFAWLPITGLEVGAAYESAIEMILAHPELSRWKYLLTFEWDNIPPPDGLMKLYESMDDYDVVGGLYWTKGELGQPMIYGNPHEIPRSFIPQMPQLETVQRCNGLGMGFNLFRMDLFRDPRWKRPWFKTQQELTPQGVVGFSQDLYFYNQGCELGLKFACDTRVKVGHLDVVNDQVW